jgi:hypothetical protein
MGPITIHHIHDFIDLATVAHWATNAHCPSDYIIRMIDLSAVQFKHRSFVLCSFVLSI